MERNIIVIGYDGSPISDRAIREAAVLLGPRPALVVVVWEPGIAFEVLDPTVSLPPIEGVGAVEVDRANQERSQRLAEHGAALAREVGLQAEGVSVADEVSVADTLLRLADERNAAAIVIGTHGHSGVRELLLGSTSHKVIQHADRPVVVVRDPDKRSD